MVLIWFRHFILEMSYPLTATKATLHGTRGGVGAQFPLGSAGVQNLCSGRVLGSYTAFALRSTAQLGSTLPSGAPSAKTADLEPMPTPNLHLSHAPAVRLARLSHNMGKSAVSSVCLDSILLAQGLSPAQVSWSETCYMALLFLPRRMLHRAHIMHRSRYLHWLLTNLCAYKPGHVLVWHASRCFPKFPPKSGCWAYSFPLHRVGFSGGMLVL